jgi:hypothetical protein
MGVLGASSSSLGLVRVRRRPWWCWGRPPPHSAFCAGEEEAMVVLVASTSSLCLVRVRRRPWWMCWGRPPPHSAWCG